MTNNLAYLLTKFESVKPIDYGDRKMVQCPNPKCGCAIEVDTTRVSQTCRECGMMFPVEVSK